MINKPPQFKGLNTRIPIIVPIRGRGFIHQGSRLGPRGPTALAEVELYDLPEGEL